MKTVINRWNILVSLEQLLIIVVTADDNVMLIKAVLSAAHLLAFLQLFITRSQNMK